ncbi:FAD/NAD(P)-binding domain-containing protein [Heliocybe sulcata]|uniref:FAD/NAD(P)-binding domain-containing protein n=1 Tax=Heliocybe sulcata TaxID=5364 RepID=A0A5C3MWZ5_9AGAM|nr:FAD/NAD(P)-binding domain-containing protein [Heliocybe sulcata]
MPSEANSLTFIIVGGSIAGLASAYTLSKAGHRVTVLEKSSAPYDHHSGSVHSPPNMTRILKEWGLKQWLDEVGVKADGVVFRKGDTGEKIGVLVYHPQIMEALRADYVFVPYRSLWSTLYDMAVKAGASVRFGANVERLNPDLPSVFTSGGGELKADFVIGADGRESVTRGFVVDQAPRGVVDTLCGFTLTVPTLSLKADPDLAFLTDRPDWNLWLGDRSCIHGYLSMGRQEYILNLILKSSDQRFRQNWQDRFPPSELNLDLSGYDTRVRKLVGLAEAITPTKYCHYAALSNLLHDSGKVFLVGEAAHTLPPNYNQNAALCIEDAVTLGALMSRAKAKDVAFSLASAFEDIRQLRSAQVSHSEHSRYEMVTLPLGTEKQKLRDESFRAALPRALRGWEDADEEYLREVWEEYIALFNYDAYEAVEDWWTKWGSFL